MVGALVVATLAVAALSVAALSVAVLVVAVVEVAVVGVAALVDFGAVVNEVNFCICVWFVLRTCSVLYVILFSTDMR